MKSSPVPSLAAAVCGLALFVAAPARADSPPPLGVLGLSASASVDVATDLLSVSFSTTREGSEANAVQGQLKQALDAALAEAKKAARPGQVEVQTGNFSLYPRYAQKGGISGWQGSAELVVEGRDMTAIGQLAGRITTLTISRVEFRLSRDASHKVEADVVAEAISKYRAKAADYAKQFGYAGYTIREVTVSGNEAAEPRPQMMRPASLASAAAPLPLEPGKATVTATVSGTVQLK